MSTRLKSVVRPPCVASRAAGRRLGLRQFSVLPLQWTGPVPPQCLRPRGSACWIPYTFPGQPQPPSERPGPAANPQPKASVLQSTQPSQPSLGPGPRQVNPPPGLSTTEWAAIQRMRENIGGEVSRPAAPSPTRSASPSPESESDSEGMLSEHEDFVELRAAPGLSELDRELQGSPVRPTRADEPAPPVVAPRPPASLTSSSPSFVEDFDDLRGDASAWRKTWLADKFRFRIPTRFHEILFMVKRALGFPPDPQEENAPVPAQSQARSLFQGVPHVASKQPRLLGDPHPLASRRLRSLSDRQPSPRGRARRKRRLRRENLLLRSSSSGTPSLLSSPQVLLESLPRETSQ